MKKHAQAILQFTGYPLEPIVAYQIKKSYQFPVKAVFSQIIPASTEALQRDGFVYTTTDLDERWFCDYE